MFKKYQPLLRIFMGSGYSNLIRFSGILLTSTLCSGFEGASYAFLLMGFGSFSGQSGVRFFNMSWIEQWIPSSNFGVFVFFVIIAILLQAIRSALTYLGMYNTSILALKIQSTAQYQVYKQIFRFNFSCVNQYKTGDLVEFARTPALFIPQLLNSFNTFVVNSCLVLMTLTGMFWISVNLTLCTGGILGAFVLGQKIIVRKIVKASTDLSNHMSDFSKQTVQSLGGLRLIHTYNEQDTALKKVSHLLKQIVASSGMLNLWTNAIPCINELIGILSIGAILLLGLLCFDGGSNATFPLLLTFVILTYRLSTRLQATIASIGGMATCYGYILRFNHILSEEGKEFYPQGGVPFKEFYHHIALENISLTYPSAKTPSLQGISFTIQKGTVTAFVGGSGGGKSSLIDLLIRLYNPSSGNILVDGKNLSDYEIGSWRKAIGVVSQDTFIFNETIEENIRFGYEEASSEQVQESARIAGAHEFIERLPAKYATLVGERGYTLSGGERQRLALARAILRNPQILILDEATSHLDSHSEKLILHALDNFCRTRTVIVVAHRLSTIVRADQILVIERGHIVEQGTHEELLHKNQKYAHFWKIQSHQTVSGAVGSIVGL